MFAHYRALHDALAVDHAAEPAAPGRVDQRSGDRAAIEGRVVAARQFAIVGHDHADRCVELAEAAQHPVLPLLLVVALDSHRAEQLLGHADLAFAMHARERLASAKFAAVGFACEDAFGIALADPVERFAGDDMEMPRLRVHRSGRAHGKREDFLDHCLRYRLVEIAPDRAAAHHHLVIGHIRIAAHSLSPLVFAADLARLQARAKSPTA